MKFLLPSLTVLSVLALAPKARSAEKPGWFVVVERKEKVVKNTPYRLKTAFRDDDKERKEFPPVEGGFVDSKYVVSPNGKMWFEIVYCDELESSFSDNLLFVGVVAKKDKRNSAVLNKWATTHQDRLRALYMDDAQWTPKGNLLISSGYRDYKNKGFQSALSYRIINPVTRKAIVDLSSLRKKILSFNPNEVWGAVNADESHLVSVVSPGESGGDAEWRNYLVDYDLRRKRVRVLYKSRYRISKLSWDIQGKHFIFSANDGIGDAERLWFPQSIYIGSTKHGRIHRLTHSPFNNESPSWSPDGKRIVWISDRPLRVGEKRGKRRLYTMNADGTNQKLFAADVDAASVSWQKDRPK